MPEILKSGFGIGGTCARRGLDELWVFPSNTGHPATKGVRQKEFGKKVTKKWQKHQKKWPKKWPKESRKRNEKSDRTPFADLLLRHPEQGFEMMKPWNREIEAMKATTSHEDSSLHLVSRGFCYFVDGRCAPWPWCCMSCPNSAQALIPLWSPAHPPPWEMGEVFFLQLELCLLTVKLLCLQSLKALIRRTFALQTKSKKLKL